MNLDQILMVLLRRAGGSITISPHEMADIPMKWRDMTIEQWQEPANGGFTFKLVDPHAPVEVKAEVVDSITCPGCGRTSHHPKDIEQRYCGACGYHDHLAIALEDHTQSDRPEMSA